MNKGISFYYGYEMNPERSVKLIKEAGFNCVITSTDKKYKYQNGSFKGQIKLLKKYNLTPSSLHSRYDSNKSKRLWEKGFKGYVIYKKLLNDVKLAHKYGFNCVVVHLYGKPSEIGIKRLEKVLKTCKKFNVPLAIENIRNRECFTAVFENIKSEYLKFCYDIGHNNAFDKDFDYLSKYGDKLVCLHLHDNMGIKDDHALNRYGNIDWKKFAKKLKEINYKGNLDYEILMNVRGQETAEEALKIVMEQAKELEQLINENKRY